jgi:hypothetical protein
MRQLFPTEEVSNMIKPRKLNSSVPKIDKPNLARDGGAKNVHVPATVPGQVRQTKGEPAAYHHGVTVDDLPNSDIIKSHEKPIGFSHGVTDAQIIKSVNSPTASQVLADAAALGRTITDKDNGRASNGVRPVTDKS